MNIQQERRNRGKSFEEEMRASWRLISNCWRLRIPDGRGASRPADELIITQDVNILAEHKRVFNPTFGISNMRPNQIRGLIDFDRTAKRNYGLIFISFNNHAIGIDEVYAARMRSLMQYLKEQNATSLTIEEFANEKLQCLSVPLIKPGLYDLTGVVANCKLL